MSSEMNFCPDCNNLMFAKEDARRRRLKFICHFCDRYKYVEPSSAQENCVEHLNFNYRPEESILVASNLSKDPTLGRTRNWYCDSCHGREALFFQITEKKGNDAMVLVFVCCNDACGKWKKQGSDEAADDIDETNEIFEDPFDETTNQVVETKLQAGEGFSYKTKSETFF